jgi:hypothetical protein
MKRVYILQMVEETDDEVKMEIHSVYSTIDKAKAIGENLVSLNDNGYIAYYTSEHLFFQ